MADHIVSLNLLLILFFSLSSASSFDVVILKSCHASLDPPTCHRLLSGYVPSNATTALQVTHSALSVLTTNLTVGQQMINDLHRLSVNVNWTRAADGCLHSIQYSKYRLKRVLSALNKSNLKDPRVWLSAALGYQYGCLSGHRSSKANMTELGASAIYLFNSTLISITSSALGMLFNYDARGNTSINWGPAKTERDGFWERVVSGSRPPGWAVGVPEGVKVNATVCKSGCTYNTVQDAVNVAPIHLKRGRRFVILIKAGVYNETGRGLRIYEYSLVHAGSGFVSP